MFKQIKTREPEIIMSFGYKMTDFNIDDTCMIG